MAAKLKKGISFEQGAEILLNIKQQLAVLGGSEEMMLEILKPKGVLARIIAKSIINFVYDTQAEPKKNNAVPESIEINSEFLRRLKKTGLERTIKSIAISDTSAEIRLEAMNLLEDAQLIFEVAMFDCFDDERSLAKLGVKKLRTQHHLEIIAGRHDSPDIRWLALNKLDEEHYLHFLRNFNINSKRVSEFIKAFTKAEILGFDLNKDLKTKRQLAVCIKEGLE